MAELVIYKIQKVNLKNVEIATGNIIYCTDTYEFYYDSNNLVRTEVSGIYFANQEAFNLYESFKVGYIYYIDNTGVYLYKNNTTVEATTSDDMESVVEAFDQLVPITMTSGLIDGIKVAPRTLASLVYTSTGELVENKLKQISRIGRTVQQVVAEEDNQRTFTIPFPFESYFENGNSMDVIVGSVIMDVTRYSISNGSITFVNTDDGVAAGRNVTFIFWYNCEAPNSDLASSVINGSYIANNSIPSSKIEKISNDIRLNDNTSIASSQAVYNVYETLSKKLTRVTNNFKAKAITTGTGDSLVITLPRFTLVDGSNIDITLHEDMLANATLKVNTEAAYPIKINGNNVPSNAYAAGQVLSLYYNDVLEEFDIMTYSDYKISSYNYHCTPAEGASIITFTIPNYVAGITPLRVYQNNLRLFEELNYTLSGNSIILNSYTTSADDIFYFEIDRVEKML